MKSLTLSLLATIAIASQPIFTNQSTRFDLRAETQPANINKTPNINPDVLKRPIPSVNPDALIKSPFFMIDEAIYGCEKASAQPILNITVKNTGKKASAAKVIVQDKGSKFPLSAKGYDTTNVLPGKTVMLTIPNLVSGAEVSVLKNDSWKANGNVPNVINKNNPDLSNIVEAYPKICIG